MLMFDLMETAARKKLTTIVSIWTKVGRRSVADVPEDLMPAEVILKVAFFH